MFPKYVGITIAWKNIKNKSDAYNSDCFFMFLLAKIRINCIISTVHSNMDLRKNKEVLLHRTENVYIPGKINILLFTSITL